mmetsp:Transcript_42168/g.75688  ORF Transcript_42168/g.75688 Transcript_42168/m.75688 type:complete len:178 (+) Transcript_42168:978-1511(+)
MSATVAEGEPDLRRLFDSWRLTNEDIVAMLSLEQSGGGALDMEAAACEFLKSADFRSRWQNWVTIEEPCRYREPAHRWDETTGMCEPVGPVTSESPVESESDTTDSGGGDGMARAAWVPTITSVAVVGILLAALSVFLATRHARLRNYVHQLENFSIENEEIAFVTPMSEAIDILRV